MSHFIKLFALCLLISPGILLQAQQPSFKDRLYVEADVHYGFVMPHISPIAYFITDHVKGFQLNVGIHTFGDKKWQQYYNYPRLGIGFYHSGLGNNEVFGQVNALFGYMDRYFFRADRRFNIGNRLAFGMAYINKKYDLRENYFDVAIGSHVNVYINYSLEGLIRLSPVTQIKLGLGMMHVSNGRFKEPNKGLNLITTFVGLQYSFHNPGTSIVAEPKETDEPGRNQLMIACSMGKKQISRKYDYSYTPTALSLEYARKVSRTSWIGMAFTTYYDPSLKKEIEMEGDTAKSGDNIRLALNVSYELKMGRFSSVFQPGFYLKNSYTKPGMINNRIGIRYQINRQWLTSVTIKAHWFAIADFIEFGLGYRWHY